MMRLGNNVTALYPYHDVVAREVAAADLVIGAVLITGAKAPHVMTREMLRDMEDGQRGGRHRHRPGRLLRDLAPDHLEGTDLHGGGRHPLLRHQHAGRGAADQLLGDLRDYPAVSEQACVRQCLAR
jgi:hypothetical protein